MANRKVRLIGILLLLLLVTGCVTVSEFDQVKSERDALSREAKFYSNENAELKSRLFAQENENRLLRGKIRELEAENKTQREEIAWLKGENENLPKQLPAQDQFDFRKTRWGMNKSQVKKTELESVIEVDDNDLLAYSGVVANMNAYIIYYFVNNKLVRAAYSFLAEHTNNNKYITDYGNLKKTITQKYGTPIIDEQVWENSMFKDDESAWGNAISFGHLYYSSDWETDTTLIRLILSGDNFEVLLVTGYYSKELKSLDEKAQQEKIQNDF